MSDPGYIWLAIVGISSATFLTRSTLHLLGSRLALPPRVESALRFAPACALAAIVVPDLVLVHGNVVLSPDNARLLGALVGAAVCLITRSALATIALGMLAFWVVRAGVGTF